MLSKRLRHWLIAALVLLLLVLSFKVTAFDAVLFWKRRAHLSDILVKMFPPAWSYASKILAPLIATIRMSVAGTVIGSFLALLIAPICAYNLSVPRLLSRIIRFIIQVLRTFPALVTALLATFIFGIGTFAGTVAISIYTFAIMTRLTYEDIESAPMKGFQAIRGFGSRVIPSYFRAIVPEIRVPFLSNALYLLETNVRQSAILGYVGAGGIGLLLNEKVSWREYDRVGMILLMLFAAVCIIEWVSTALGKIVRGERSLRSASQHILIVCLLLIFLFCLLSGDPPAVERGGLRTFRAIVMGMAHPDWSFFFDLSSTGLSYLLLETVAIAFVGTLIGSVFAIPLSFFNTTSLVSAPVAAVFRFLVMLIRSVPFIIYGLIFIRVTGPGAFAGVLTIAICSIGLLTKRFTEALENLDYRAFYALKNMGVSFLPRLRHAIFPQLRTHLVSALFYRFDVNVREASILGLVGAGGIGAPLVFAMNKFAWNMTGSIFLGLVIVVYLVDILSTHVRKRAK